MQELDKEERIFGARRYIQKTLVLWAFIPHLFIIFLILVPMYTDINLSVGIYIILVFAFLILLESLSLLIILYKHFPKIRLYHPLMIVFCTIFASIFYLPFSEFPFLKGSAFLLAFPVGIGLIISIGQLINDKVLEEYVDITKKT